MASTAFGSKKRLPGKAYRDGILGDVLDDIYKDVEEGFAQVQTVTDASSGAIAAAVAVTNGGAGNAGKLFKADANGKLEGRVIATDGTALDAAVLALSKIKSATFSIANGASAGNTADLALGTLATAKISCGVKTPYTKAGATAAWALKLLGNANGTVTVTLVGADGAAKSNDSDAAGVVDGWVTVDAR